MKRLFFLLIVAVASVLPQIAWAEDPTTNEASLDETTGVLTITSTKAGNLHAGSVDGFSSLTAAKKAAVTKIVLWGYFNADDLEDLRGRVVEVESENIGIFLNVTEVDMSEAQFVLADNEVPSQAFYYLYHTGTQLGTTGTTGDRAIVGGTLYKSAQNGTWISVSAPTEETPVVDNINTGVTTGYAIGTYGKNNGVAKYVQMHVTAHTWSGPFTKGYDNFAVPSSATQLTASSFADETTVLNGQLNNYYGGQYVYFNRYYKTQYNSTTNQYEWVEGTEDNYNNATGNHYIDPSGINLNELSIWYANQGDHPEGNVMLVKVYYQKQDNSKEWVDPTPENPADTESATDMSAYEYAYCNNHKDGYTNGQWVKLTAWSYYQFQATNPNSWHWEQVSTYNNGDGYYINIKYPYNTDMSNPGGNMPNADNQYAVVMGSNEVEGNGEYYRNGSSWKNPSQATNTPHYVDMRFDYWKTSLQRAITSKYADEDINPEIFKECTALRYVDFKAGVVKGFGDHTTTAGYYTPFKIKIGKDVTKIDNAAFRRCDVLTEVEWDTYTADEKSSGSYPKSLIIEAEAFLQARNLMSIKIPNRVTYIGDNAFEEVGTDGIHDINAVEVNDDPTVEPTFKLIFERRHESDTDQGSVAINCDMPLTLGTKAFFNCWYLKELSLPIRLKQMGDDCFKNSLSLTTLEMREETKSDYTGPKLTTIPSGAFEYSGVHEVTIPKSVTRIVNKAFGSTTGLTKVTFQDDTESTLPNLFIESGAFSGGREEGRPQLDIYVMVDPSHRKMICEYAAFNYTQTVGQTSTLQNFAILHFPEDAWDYYQGDWKRGLAFRQDNLNAFKDGYHDDVKGYDGKSGGSITTEGANTGKYVHATEGKQYTPANGWQEFARTSTTIDIVIPNTGSFLRTYSTTTAKAIPLYAEDDTQQQVHAGDPFFKVYRISHFNDGWQVGDEVTGTPSTTPIASATEVKLHYDGAAHEGNNYANAYIPAHTGLLMVGYGSGSVSYIVYMNDVTSGASATYGYTSTQFVSLIDDVTYGTNLLFPSCDDDGVGTITRQGTENGVPYVYLNPTYPYPYNTSTNPLQFRFFGLGNKTVDGNKVYYFARFKEGGKATRDKAYLRLTNEVFHWRNGHIGSQNVDPNANPSVVNPSRVALNFFDDEEESGTTGIKQIDTTTQRMDSNVFYTLEGVRLNARPTQRGIYIHNGRKIVIK